jgi:hypothetical protein
LKIPSFPHFLFTSTTNFTMATKEWMPSKTDLALGYSYQASALLATLESHANSNNSSNNQGPKPAKLALSQTAAAFLVSGDAPWERD